MPEIFEGRNETTSGLSAREGHDAFHRTQRQLEPGQIARGDLKYQATEDVFRVVRGQNTLVNRAGDRWLHVTSMQNNSGVFLPVDLWIAEIHMGRPYLTVRSIEDPPAGETRTITYVELDDSDQSVWLPVSVTADNKIVLQKQ